MRSRRSFDRGCMGHLLSKIPRSNHVPSDCYTLYLDLYSSLVGNELVLTNNASGDFHPTQAGYEVIAQQFTSAVVPEPASLALLLIGAGGALIAKRLRPIAAEAS